MASKQKKQYDALKTRTDGYAKIVSERFSKAVNDLLALKKTYNVGGEEFFSFEDNPKLGAEAQKILRELHSSTYAAIRSGIVQEWGHANDAMDEFLSDTFGKKVLREPNMAGWLKRNTEAMDAFIGRTVNGMNLSDRVWKTAEQLKGEMEMAISVSIGEGKSAAEVSREVREYLKEPNRLFRRVKDKKTGKMKLSQAAKAYHPGRGVYRSSYKNAMRLTRTETNMAYRSADYERWQQMDFIKGIRIELSRNHPEVDICDTLQGVYPKTFKFTGWHPNCFCHVIPLTVKEDDFVKMQQAMLKGETHDVSSQMVKEMPEGFVSWAEMNKERLLDAKENGTLPYFARDNWKIFEDVYNPVTNSEIYKLGEATLKDFEEISDVDKTGLKDALSGKDLSVIDEETKKLQAIKDELNNLQHVEDGFNEAKIYGYQEILKAEKTVSAKLDYWKNTEMLPLEKIAQKVDGYANNFLGNNLVHPKTKMHAHDQYPSWKVQQKAMLKEYGKIQEEIEWNKAISFGDKYDGMGGFSKATKALTDKLDDLIYVQTTHDLAAVKKVTAELDQWLSAKTEYDAAIMSLKSKTGGIGSAKAAAIDAKKNGDLAAFKKATAGLKDWQLVEPALEEALMIGTFSDSKFIQELSSKLEKAYMAGDIKAVIKLSGDAKTWEASEKLLKEAKKVAIKGKNYNNAVAEMEKALNAGDKAAFDAAFKEADKQKKYALSRRKDKNGKSLVSTSGGGVFQDTYTQERRDAALWDKGNGSKADAALFDTASEYWKAAIEREKAAKELIQKFEAGKITEAEFKKTIVDNDLKVFYYEEKSRFSSSSKKVYMTEREAMYEYTHHYCDVNEPLENRAYDAVQNEGRFFAKANAMTSYIDSCATPQDMWFQRGDSGLDAIVGRLDFAGSSETARICEAVSAKWKRSGTMTDEMVESLQELVGKTMQEGGFMSMGSAKRHGFDEGWGKNVIINVFAPKGTKAMYAEHFSLYGHGVKSASWKGGHDSTHFSKEFETIAQRGTVMKITKIEKGRYDYRDIIYIDVDIIGQDVRDISYVKRSNISTNIK